MAVLIGCEPGGKLLFRYGISFRSSRVSDWRLGWEVWNYKFRRFESKLREVNLVWLSNKVLLPGSQFYHCKYKFHFLVPLLYSFSIINLWLQERKRQQTEQWIVLEAKEKILSIFILSGRDEISTYDYSY